MMRHLKSFFKCQSPGRASEGLVLKVYPLFHLFKDTAAERNAEKQMLT